jgi:hypothetical protein
MGARHVAYGAAPIHYPVVGEALMRTLKYFFKDQWSADLDTTWTTAYQVISDTMLEGAREHQDQSEAHPVATPAPVPSVGQNLPPNFRQWLNVWSQDILKEAVGKVTNSPQFKAEIEKVASDILNEYLHSQADQFRSEFKKAA